MAIYKKGNDMLKTGIKLFLSILILYQSIISVADACTLTYGTHQPNSAILEAHWAQSPLNHALANATHCSIVLKTYSSADDLRKAVLSHQVDIAFLKDFNFYLIKKKMSEIKPLAVALSYNPETKTNSATYTGFILSLPDKKINSIDSLSGKSMGFLLPESTSGFILPILYLADQNKDYKTFFGKTTIYNSVTKAITALKSGEVDAIAVWNPAFVSEDLSKMKVLKTFPNIPNPIIVLTHPLKDVNFNDLQKAIVSIPVEKDPKILIQGYTTPEKVDYTALFKSYDEYCKLKPEECL
jgi:ABC-type phosphate/phosphonate transport system substrate-binding protein